MTAGINGRYIHVSLFDVNSNSAQVLRKLLLIYSQQARVTDPPTFVSFVSSLLATVSDAWRNHLDPRYVLVPSV